MLAQTITMDSSRRITFPKRVLDVLGITTKDEMLLEMTHAGVLIKPKQETPLTDKLASMNLPILDWEQMEAESDMGLLRKINEDIPDVDRKRFNNLHSRRDILSENEHEEFLQLIQLIEKKDAERIWYIAELAELRGVSVDVVMSDLEIFQANHV